MCRTFVNVLCLALMTIISGQVLTSGPEMLDIQRKVSLSWSNDLDSITFEISAPARGYVGFGISPDGTMLEADMAIGWVIDGKAFLDDRYSTEYKQPVIDNQQDYSLISGTQNGTHTTLRFRRKLVTGDKKDHDIKAGVMNLIFAYDDIDPTDGHSIKYHGTTTRGTKSVVLIN